MSQLSGTRPCVLTSTAASVVQPHAIVACPPMRALTPTLQHNMASMLRKPAHLCCHSPMSATKVHLRRVGATAAALADPTPAAPSSPPSRPGTAEGRLLPVRLGPLQLMEQQYLVAGHTLTLVAPADVDAVMDMYIEQAMNDSDPYWTRVWPSAIALASQILERPELVAGKSVVDLGCGLGLAGMAAAMAGAKEVLLLDRELLALQCALASARASGLTNVQSLGGLAVEQSSAQAPHTGSAPSSVGTLGLSFTGDGADRYAGTSLQQGGVEALRGAANSASSSAASTSTSTGSVNAPSTTSSAAVPSDASSSSDATHSPPTGHSPATTSRQPQRETNPSTSQPHEAISHKQNTSATSTYGTNNAANPSSRSGSPAGAGCNYRAQVFDWNRSTIQQRYDVVLACDVLYEQDAVEPISQLLPKLLKASGARLLLADPPNRTAQNRERFVQLLQQAASGSSSSRGMRFLLEECYSQECEVSKLDNEMVGGVTTEHIPVQLMIFKTTVSNDTIGLKL